MSRSLDLRPECSIVPASVFRRKSRHARLENKQTCLYVYWIAVSVTGIGSIYRCEYVLGQHFFVPFQGEK